MTRGETQKALNQVSLDAQVTLAEKRSKLQRRRAGSLMVPAAENPERNANRRKSIAVARERYPTNNDGEEPGTAVSKTCLIQ